MLGGEKRKRKWLKRVMRDDIKCFRRRFISVLLMEKYWDTKNKGKENKK